MVKHKFLLEISSLFYVHSFSSVFHFWLSSFYANQQRIQFINNVPPNIAKVSVNKEELDEIILNLTQNATHAISGNGMISFNAEEKDESVIIEISDTGSGMSEETIAHIFDPFFTTRSKGFGLGLFVVKELAQRNKGEIFVESRVGEGTKFKLEFQKTGN